MRTMMIAAAALALGATPALGQVNTGSGNGLVAVNIQDVSLLNNFLNNDQISALNNLGVPITVNVPVGIGASALFILFLHERLGSAARRVDVPGAVLFTVSVVPADWNGDFVMTCSTPLPEFGP